MLDLTLEAIEEIVEAIAAMNGDSPGERRGVATATLAKHNNGEPVTGLPAFIENNDLGVFAKTLRKWLKHPDQTAAPPDASAIRLDDPEEHVVVTNIARFLAANSERLFMRGGELSRLKRLEAPELLGGVSRVAGTVKIVPAQAPWLAFEAGRTGGKFRRGNKPASPTYGHMTMLLAAADEFPFRPLTTVSLTPLLDRDEPGYDPTTGVYLDFAPGAFPRPPEHLTVGEAQEALKRLRRPLRGFPFVDAAAESAALAGLVAGVIRPELRTCPAFVIGAPSARTGKTKLAEVMGVLATGVSPAAISYSGRPEEDKKCLAAVLRAGDQVMLIDNVSIELENDLLCSMLTNETVQPRILGLSETFKPSTRILVLVTGNNVRVKGDLAHRGLLIRLDAGVAKPDERAFDFDPVEEVKANRERMVVDALTIVRAYRSAGRPDDGRLRPFGGFRDFDLIRGALVWLGLPDPASTREGLREGDLAVEERVEAIRLIVLHIGLAKRFTVQKVAIGARYTEFRSQLAALIGCEEWNGARVGRLLSRIRDVPTHGVRVRGKPSSANVTEWWVEGEPDEALASYLAASDEMDQM